MEISPCFILIQKRESEASNIECFMESNGNSPAGNRFHTGLDFFVYHVTFSQKNVKDVMENNGNRWPRNDTRICFLSLACFVPRCKIRFHSF